MTSFRSFLLILALPVYAQVSFQDWVVNAQDQLLMQLSTETARSSFSSLYSLDLSTNEVEPLSFYPEKLYAEGLPPRLVLVNHLGTFLADESIDHFAAIAELPGFPEQVQTGVLEEPVLSPDGDYLLSLQSTQGMRGDLVLVDLARGRRYTVSEDIALRAGPAPVLWDPRSKFFFYEKDGTIYSFFMDLYRRGAIQDEAGRKFADLSLERVAIDREGAVYFVEYDNVYRVPSDQIFVTTVYTGYLKHYAWLRTLPFAEDAGTLYASPDGKWIAIAHEQSTLSVISATVDSSSTYVDSILSFAEGERIEKLLWSRYNVITVLTTLYRGGQQVKSLYSFALSDESTWRIKKIEYKGGVRDIALSRLGSYIAVFTESEGVGVYRHRDWEFLQSFTDDYYHSGAWISDTEMVLGSASSLHAVNVEGDSRFVTVSQVSVMGFAERRGEERVFASLPDGSAYIQNEGLWRKATRQENLKDAQKQNSRYTISIKEIDAPFFQEHLEIRDILQVDASSFPEALTQVTDLVQQTAAAQRKVAIVFNVAQNDTGLSKVVDSLYNNDLRATFFLNGDFMRRSPHLLRVVSDAGHEAGSMFDTYVNFSDPRYRMNYEHLREGLDASSAFFARETGAPLSKLWHSPYYTQDAGLVSQAEAHGFQFVDRNFDADPVDPRAHNVPSAVDRLDRILDELTPGSVIAMTAGSGDAYSAYSYSFPYLDILIKRIQEAGYTVTTVSELLQGTFQ